MNLFAQHGAFSWTELTTPNPEQVIPFYEQLFDWKFKTDDSMPDYHTIEVAGTEVGGVFNSKANPDLPPDLKPFWGVYVTVSDIDATIVKVTELGGTVLNPPIPIPNVGRMAVIADPQGATIFVIAYELATA